jgi:hypothetical protein
MKLVNTENLEVGKTYYFDKAKNAHGIFHKKENDLIFFQAIEAGDYLPLTKNDDAYEEGKRLVGFSAISYEYIEKED